MSSLDTASDPIAAQLGQFRRSMLGTSPFARGNTRVAAWAVVLAALLVVAAHTGLRWLAVPLAAGALFALCLEWRSCRAVARLWDHGELLVRVRDQRDWDPWLPEDDRFRWFAEPAHLRLEPGPGVYELVQEVAQRARAESRPSGLVLVRVSAGGAWVWTDPARPEVWV